MLSSRGADEAARSSPSSGRPRPARARSRSRSPSGIDGEIINCDSTAVYRGFDIGTDKMPLAERRGIPHHLIDIVDPTDDYTAAQYARDAAAAIRDIHARGRLPILVGGTGFYYPRADARAVSRARARRGAARGGSSRSPRAAASTFLHRMLRERRSRSRRCASSRAI